jgi:hypothetical protein
MQYFEIRATLKKNPKFLKYLPPTSIVPNTTETHRRVESFQMTGSTLDKNKF